MTNGPIHPFALAAVIMAGACFAPASSAAQSGAARAALEKLSAFEGTWHNTNPADAGVFEETCSWMPTGRRHMVCTPRWTRSSGVVQHQTVYSYRGRDSTYIVTAFLANGPVWTYHGREEGGRWIFALQPDQPNNPQRLRMTVTVGRDSIRFVEESSMNGAPWVVTEDYRHVRAMPPEPAVPVETHRMVRAGEHLVITRERAND